MITNQGVAAREDEVALEESVDGGSLPSPAARRPNSTEQVTAAFTAAARGGLGSRESAFDVAVRTYIACYPETSWDVAARIVADIISHRS